MRVVYCMMMMVNLNLLGTWELGIAELGTRTNKNEQEKAAKDERERVRSRSFAVVNSIMQCAELMHCVSP